MAILKWDESYSVKVRFLDEQHKTIIALINTLDEAIREKVLESGAESRTLKKIFEQLLDYTQTHFVCEEEMMRIFEYPQYKEHVEKHRALQKKINGYYEEFSKGEMNLSHAVLRFLLEWLKEHIAVVDKHYSDFFNSLDIR